MWNKACMLHGIRRVGELSLFFDLEGSPGDRADQALAPKGHACDTVPQSLSTESISPGALFFFFSMIVAVLTTPCRFYFLTFPYLRSSFLSTWRALTRTELIKLWRRRVLFPPLLPSHSTKPTLVMVSISLALICLTGFAAAGKQSGDGEHNNGAVWLEPAHGHRGL